MAVAKSSDTKGFFRSLYDFGFTSLIGTRFLKFVYGLLVTLASLAEIGALIALLSQKSDPFGGNVVSNNGGVFAILSVLYYFMTLIWLRISIEFLIVFFQMGDNLRAIRSGGLELSPIDAVARQSTPARAAEATPPAVEITPAEAATPAGWFEAPGDPTQFRYWDGTSWTEHFAPKGGLA